MVQRRKLVVSKLPLKEIYTKKTTHENEDTLNRISHYILRLAYKRRTENIMDHFAQSKGALDQYFGLNKEDEECSN